MIIKIILLKLQANILTDILVLWSIFFLMSLIQIISFFYVSNSHIFKCSIFKTNSELKKQKLDYMQASRVIKTEMIQLFIAIMLTFISFPGIMYSMYPKRLLTRKEYINYSNMSSSIVDIIGRVIGTYEYNRIWTKVGIVLLIFIDSFIVYCFLTEFYVDYHELTYVFIAITTFLIFHAANQISYTMYKAGIKSNSGNQEAIGVLMTNTLFTGMAVGNIISLFLTDVIKRIK